MLALVLALTLISASEGAPGADAPLASPQWLRRPTGEDMATHYPERAAKKALGGAVELTCTVTDVGLLTNCSAREVETLGVGFDKSARRLARFFPMKAVDGDGQPVAGRTVVVPIIWNLARLTAAA